MADLKRYLPEKFKKPKKPISTKMLNLGGNSKIWGPGHLILNALRACTIITLGTVIVSSWAMIVLSGITGHFQFFDMISHFFTFMTSIFLVISELGLFKTYFEKHWPVLSPGHSLMWLGFSVLVIGCEMLADTVKPAYTEANLGQAMYRLVLSAGILAVIMGVFNLLCSVIFRDGEQGITARMIRSHGTLAAMNNRAFSAKAHSARSFSNGDSYSQRSEPYYRQTDEEKPSAMKRMTNYFMVRKSQISRPFISSPLEADVEHNARAGPLQPDIPRPPTRLHPAYTGASSHYSVAHMDI
ncbi:hypothetical protein B0H63DRAFT_521016 [Podospora didyma]|uniref:DUF7598 domain-containing protein n=1 Tax=Podospora didyma TaxID=330526 RepID=A0AAE0NSI5_9PEZI|nr:hypothetical protein B0H63DRAFT_521016 [Podospora didyma]